MTRISVVMSVYNGGERLGSTVDSILAQTEHDFELIVVDDGSTDETPALLRRYASADARIRVITQTNAGLTRALMAGCAAARGALIARHDIGDVSHPQRLAKQKELFDSHDDLVLASCRVDFAGPEFEWLYTAGLSGVGTTPAAVFDPKAPRLMTDGPSHHGSVMFRRDAYERAGGYRPEFYYGQDWDLWYRMAALGKFANVPETLYTARVFPSSITVAAREMQESLASLARASLLARHEGRSDHDLLAQAAAIRGGAHSGRRVEAEGLYFIGEALRRNGHDRARFYLASAIRRWPLNGRAWIRYVQSLIQRRVRSSRRDA